MNDYILNYVVSNLRAHVTDNLPLSPAGVHRLLNEIETMQRERREKPVSATIRPA